MTLTGEGIGGTFGGGSESRSSEVDDVNYDRARRSRCLCGFQKVKRVPRAPHRHHHHRATSAPPPHHPAAAAAAALLCSFTRECTGKILFAGWRVWASLSLPCIKTERDYTFCASISHISMSIGAIYKYRGMVSRGAATTTPRAFSRSLGTGVGTRQ